jgi:hypothetical protein
MDKLQVKKLDKKFYKKYEIFLLEFTESLLYYSTKYKDFLEELLNVESNYLMVVDESNNIQAILPIMQKEGTLGTIINTLPYYGSNGGIIAKNDDAYNVLLNYYDELANTVSGATYINNPLNINKEKVSHDYSDIRIGHWTSLEKTDDIPRSVMTSYHSKTRNLVRKAIKSNVEVSIDNNEKKFLYQTHVENMQSVGGIAKEKMFFDLLDKHFTAGEDYNIYIAKYEGKKIGAILLFYYNQTVEYFTPVAVSEYRNYQSTSLMVYQAMIDAIEKNYTWWNWGGTWLSQDGVYHFKSRFGAIDKKYSYFIKINNKDIYYATKEKLLNEYQNFYVIPFDKLRSV